MDKQEQINEMIEAFKTAIGDNALIDMDAEECALDCNGVDHAAEQCAKALYNAGYRKASEVIDEFVEKINLVECEMFHKAHDIRNSSEEKLDRCNWKDDLLWGEYKKQEGKMIALQDFMTKIKRIAADYGVEVGG